MQSNQLLERRDGFDVAPVTHPEVPQRNFRAESQFTQPRRFCVQESTRQPGIRFAPPECQRVDEHPVGRGVVSCGDPLGGVCDAGGETVRIELVRFELERVSTGVSPQSCARTRRSAERLAQSRHVGLQRGLDPVRRVVVPHLIDQPRYEHGMPGRGDQDSEQRSRLRSTQIGDAPVVQLDLKVAEDPHFHAPKIRRHANWPVARSRAVFER